MTLSTDNLISHFKATNKIHFSLEEIISIIQLNTANVPIESMGVILDKEQRICKYNGYVIQLTLKEFELLGYLMSNINKVQTRDRILNSVWGEDVYVSGRTVDVHINKLRVKLGTDMMIETKKGVGYMWKEVF